MSNYVKKLTVETICINSKGPLVEILQSQNGMQLLKTNLAAQHLVPLWMMEDLRLACEYHFTFQGYIFLCCVLIRDNVTTSLLFPYILSLGTLKTLTFFMEIFKDFQILWHSYRTYLNYRTSTQGGSVRLRLISSTGRS